MGTRVHPPGPLPPAADAGPSPASSPAASSAAIARLRLSLGLAPRAVRLIRSWRSTVPGLLRGLAGGRSPLVCALRGHRRPFPLSFLLGPFPAPPRVGGAGTLALLTGV